MANNIDDSKNEAQCLSSLFKEGLDNYNRITNSDQPTNNPDMQVVIKKFHYF